MDGKLTFEQVFKLTGRHLGAAAVGFLAAALFFAPKPREKKPLPTRTAQILELRAQARAAASAAPGATPALARATELCRALAWPACDAASIQEMGKLK